MKVLPRKAKRTAAAERTPKKDVVDEKVMRSPTKLNALPEAPMSASWATLPILNKILDKITDPKDLVACACVCKSWSDEVASSDYLFKDAWTRQVSDQGLWRWARAAGGYRAQLRADSVVRKGDCVATVFPLNRGEGRISEVLLLDASPEPRICICTMREAPPDCIRLIGWTVRVWSAATLCSQKGPLCTVHDVVKHIQLEDGRLFLWRIKEGAFIQIRSSVGVEAAQAEEEQERITRWAENPNIIASILDPITLEVVDIPLDSTYGHRMCPFEFIDGGTSGVLISGGAFSEDNSLKIRLLDLHTGRCFKESSIILPDVSIDVVPLDPNGSPVFMSRNSDAAGQYLAAAVMYDCRVFKWRLKDEWMAPETRYTPHSLAGTTTTDSQYPQGLVGAGENLASAAAAPQSLSPLEAAIAAAEAGGNPPGETPGLYTLPNIPYGIQNSIKTEYNKQFSLHHIFTTPRCDAIVDLSVSTAAQRIYVLGLETVYLLGDDGTLNMTCRMSHFRGVFSSRRYRSNYDVGAFSWPIPNSNQAAFYLDVTNSIYIADFDPAPKETFPSTYLELRAEERSDAVQSGQLPYREKLRILVEDIDGHFHFQPQTQISLMPVQCHTNLVPKPKDAPTSTVLTGRMTLDPGAEPVIVEYIQSGKTIFTAGNSSCPATAALLKAEKDKGTYLYGLGPKSVMSGKGTKRGPFVSRPDCDSNSAKNNKKFKNRTSGKSASGSSNSDLAPRALICIDTKTGQRYKVIPIEGVIESVHAAGHLLVAVVAPVDRYPKGAEGSVVVIDFSKEGFGLTDAQRAAYKEEMEGTHNVVGKDTERKAAETGHEGPSKAKKCRRRKY